MIKTLIKEKEYTAIVYWGMTFKTNKDSVQFAPVVHRVMLKTDKTVDILEFSVYALDIDLSKAITPCHVNNKGLVIFKNV